MGDGKVAFHLGYGWWFGILSFAFVFFFGEKFFTSASCFLDRACIHQENIELKLKGIQCLSDILQKSNKMLILWQREYFTRLWCGFELAMYLKHRSAADIVLCPLNM